MTETHAIEFEFAGKWTEAVGQSLHYSLQTGKRAGIVLILESDSDRKFWIRLNSSIAHFKLPIDARVIGGGSGSNDLNKSGVLNNLRGEYWKKAIS